MSLLNKRVKDYSCIKLTEGKFKDVIYYGRVAFAPKEKRRTEGRLPMKFDYVDKNPNNLILA